MGSWAKGCGVNPSVETILIGTLAGFFNLSRAIPVGFNRAPKDHGFLTSGRSGRLLFELGGNARRDVHVSVRKFLDIRSDHHVRID